MAAVAGDSALARTAEQDPQRPRARGALLVAAACGLALVGVGVLADLASFARHADYNLLVDCIGLRSGAIGEGARQVSRVFNPRPYAIWTALILAFTLWRRGWRTAVALAALLALAPITAELMKPVINLQHIQVGRIGVETGSWPSGHAAGAVALVLCALVLAPASLRAPVATLGTALVLAVGFSLQVLESHMLSDVIGGYLVAGVWAGLVVACARLLARRRRSAAPSPAPPGASV